MLLLLDHSCTYTMIINQCPSNHYSSCRSLLSLHRRRFRVLPRHRFNSVFELDGLDGPLLETPDVGNNLLAIIDVHSEQSIISFIREDRT
jgi:hypothetical protein